MATGRIPDPNSAPITAKGDLYTYSTVPARLAVGNNGETLVADSSATTGLRWQGSSTIAAKNALINGGFDIWQRSTSAATSTGTYPAPDRWWAYTNSGSATFARESTVIPSGALYAGKITATANNTQVFFSQVIETANIAPFINKTVTVSGQLAASTTVAHTLLVQYSTTVDDSNSGSWTTISASTTSGSLTPTSTTYVSFANTYAIPSNAKSVRVGIQPTSTIANGVVCYYGNFQLELGSVATTFSRAGGTIAGELAACQRYFYMLGNVLNDPIAYGGNYSAALANCYVKFPVSMRTNPTLSATSGTNYYSFVRNGGTDTFNSFTLDVVNTNGMVIFNNSEISGTAGNAGYFAINNASGSIAFSAEL